jgi:hypothetical protein
MRVAIFFCSVLGLAGCLPPSGGGSGGSGDGSAADRDSDAGRRGSVPRRDLDADAVPQQHVDARFPDLDRGFEGVDRGPGDFDRGFGDFDEGFGDFDEGFVEPDNGFDERDFGFPEDDFGFDRGFDAPDRGLGPDGGEGPFGPGNVPSCGAVCQLYARCVAEQVPDFDVEFCAEDCESQPDVLGDDVRICIGNTECGDPGAYQQAINACVAGG